MLSLDGLFKALAAVVTFAFAAIVVAGRGRPATRGYLAAFLLLLWVNQGVEAWRTLLTDEGARLVLARVAAVAAALDPAALVLFAASLTRERAVDRWALPLAAVGGGLALWSAWSLTDDRMGGRDRIFHMLLVGYTAIAYTSVLVWAVGHLARPGSPRWWRPLVVGIAIVALPTWARAASSIISVTLRASFDEPLNSQSFPVGEPLGYWVIQVLVGAALAILGGLLARRWMRMAEVAPRRASLVAALVTLVLLTMMSHEIGLVLSLMEVVPYRDLTIVGRSSAPVRWLFFGAALSLVVLRDEAVTLAPPARRLATRVVAALAALVAVSLAFSILSAATQSRVDALPPVAWVVLAASLVLSQGFRSGVDRLVARISPPALPTERPRITGLATGGIVAGRYRVEALLGRGGGGRAFLAEDQTLRRRVVLKEVVGIDAEDAPLREARIAGSIQHPNVLTVHDVIVGEDRAVIVTEYASGGSLADALARGPLDARTAMSFASGILDGLAAVHDAGVVHRDLKPANVFLQGEVPKIGDFGIASLAAGRTAQFAGAPAGTPGFAAPEQVEGRPATKASDVYAAGRLVQAAFPAPLPPPLSRVVERALERDPTNRFPDARAMSAALREAMAQVQ